MQTILSFVADNVDDTATHWSAWIKKPIEQAALRLGVESQAQSIGAELSLSVEVTADPDAIEGYGATFASATPEGSRLFLTDLTYIHDDTDKHSFATPDFNVAGFAYYRVGYSYDDSDPANSLGILAVVHDESSDNLNGDGTARCMQSEGEPKPEHGLVIGGVDLSNKFRTIMVSSVGRVSVSTACEFSASSQVGLTVPAAGAWSDYVSITCAGYPFLQVALTYMAHSSEATGSHLEAALEHYAGNDTWIPHTIADISAGDYRPATGDGYFKTADVAASATTMAEYRLDNVASSNVRLRFRQAGSTTQQGTYSFGVYMKS